MRRGELFKLRWTDVDLNAGTVRVIASNSKTERSRAIGLTIRSRAELERLWTDSHGDLNGLVFGVTNTIKNSWRTAMTESAIHDFVFHDLRHTGTTRMIRAGVPASEVMKITGHTQMKTFLRYLNLTDESVLNSAAMLDEYLGSGVSSPPEIPTISAQLQ